MTSPNNERHIHTDTRSIQSTKWTGNRKKTPNSRLKLNIKYSGQREDSENYKRKFISQV